MSHEKLKTMLMQNFGWKTKCIMGDVYRPANDPGIGNDSSK